MTEARWKWFASYADELLGDRDDQMLTMMERAEEAGIPDWAITADVGRLLAILAASTAGRVAVELGTLAGYSTIWIARGMPPSGKVITIEYADKHADFAESEFAEAGLSGQIEVIRGRALDVIPSLGARFGLGGIDFVFIDAVKDEYVAYFEELKPLIAVGGIVVADNVYGTGRGWIDEGYGTDEFNRLVASDRDFETTLTPMRQGLLIARRVS